MKENEREKYQVIVNFIIFLMSEEANNPNHYLSFMCHAIGVHVLQNEEVSNDRTDYKMIRKDEKIFDLSKIDAENFIREFLNTLRQHNNF